ncbi:glutamate-5-semialdehyde dehydrogenase [Kurthia sibirica]|uniref:Gamma-glutamyl phosphate reductase n=1 Tax=Kurthia sibirica TaxID=202750 RepID=A0A2U3ANF6_9BACL|nr:glutamate-5-semialdehyde dehydrogenase [Kurthia sibirica]PWI26029.1 glutamate-5-semialdehyde dehydrogenase [Kurthia sibirica]GEK34570.1 gamma-glutamyl phosphate reductase [Kurthia sibirica]
MSEVYEKGRIAKKASFVMNNCTTVQKNEALTKIADQLLKDEQLIIEANNLDLQQGRNKGLSESILDRIMINHERLVAIHDAVLLLVDLQDPIAEVLEEIDKENGLHIEKRRVPLGVIGMIYEARPNVTVDAATLALKTGNAVVLRGSSSAKQSNIAIVKSIHHALENSSLPKEAVQLIEDTSRKTAAELFTLKEFLDVLIPRGSKTLIDTVVAQSTVPVLETGAGNCHVFIDEDADYLMAEKIVLNAKTHRTSVCNAAESLLIHSRWNQNFTAQLVAQLLAADITLYGDEIICGLSPQIIPATEEDWSTEYLAMAMSIKVVDCLDEAIAHINQYGTKHSEAIITPSVEHATYFTKSVDAAAVYHNASTRFTDGFEFGYGAEIGISTQKLHARGPMGLTALTSTKYFIEGNGQIRE